jgi:mono/diheme cytochrome c family protein
VPDNTDADGRPLRGIPIREIIPLQFRGKQSSDAWSTCASCHPAGLADGVTWTFADGPRQTIPMDGLYSKVNGAHDTRINNWSAARDSVTDFNNNSRNVQCGKGFAGGDPTQNAAGNGACPSAGATPPNPAIFDHGISQGASEALDMETTWAQTIRPFNMPQGDPAQVSAGAVVFKDNCTSCHGGAKWTKSQVLYLNNPAFKAAGGPPRDPGLNAVGNEIVAYTDTNVDPNPLQFLEDIGTFNAANLIEIRGQGNPGGPSFGARGFNVPSLLSVGFHAPYFHNGQATTLEDVFAQHQLPGGGTIQDLAGAAVLLEFVKAIDGRTATFESQTDTFKDPTR